jgi:thiol-disulfide isomerase/thioredoxin
MRLSSVPSRLIATTALVLLLALALAGCGGGSQKSAQGSSGTTATPAGNGETGTVAPGYELADLTGKMVSNREFAGKVVILDFWATWCPPCRESLPHVVQLYKDQHDKGLEIVGVSNDSSKPDLKQFLVQNKDMAWPQLFGPAPPSGWHALAKKYEVPSIPNYWVIDREGILRISHTNRFPDKQVLALLDPPAKPATRPAAVAKAEPAPAPPTPPPAAPAPPAAAKPTTNPATAPTGLPSWAR